MKVLNLRCTHDHRFEGWFASDDDFSSQHQSGQVACPVCNDTAVSRLPSAPRLNVSNLREVSAPPAAASDDPTHKAQAHFMQALRHMIQNTEDVGARFPEEARRIHYGEVEQRGIRGQASPEDAEALRDEGIEVVSVPIPAALKGPLQ
jgi:hypothetical protein